MGYLETLLNNMSNDFFTKNENEEILRSVDELFKQLKFDFEGKRMKNKKIAESILKKF